MSNWSGPGEDPDADLKQADELLQKADALLRRHRPGSDPAPLHAHDDLPILTDVIDDFVSTDSPPGRSIPENITPVVLAECLVKLDTELARAVESWFANELPQLVTKELDRLSERLRVEALAHMRSTLIPTLSELIADRLDRTESDRR